MASKRRDREREAATGLRIPRRMGHAARRGPYVVSPEDTSRVAGAGVCTGARSRDALVLYEIGVTLSI
jgi:hypothetical protein